MQGMKSTKVVATMTSHEVLILKHHIIIVNILHTINIGPHDIYDY